MERIANQKTKARRIQDTIESTLHNMEVAEEIIASDPDNKKAQELIEANERRSEEIPQMIRQLKEEKAREELEADSLTHTDFLLFRKMDRSPVMAIEVDGTSFHTAGSKQAERDAKKLVFS